jgi:5-methylcytosine-specific restriction endonuclease McrA
MGRPAKILKKEDILRAMKTTRSNRAAARYLHVSFTHYKKYAKVYKDEETGSTLYQLHKNQSGKGIPKFLTNGGKEPPIIDLIEGRIPVEHFDPQKIKQRLIFEALLDEKCAYCGFSERRVLDTKVPLVLNHKDGNKKNWNLDNLEFLCYNHAFLYATSPITDKQVEAMEDYVDRNVEEVNWELDEHHIEHLRELGLYQEEEKPGEKYISRQ